jgi:hypothetical protein
MAAKNCGLCREAEKQPADTTVFFLKDINPLKPNRWLALPRAHTHALKDVSPEARLALWNAAIEKARSMWGDQWGLAVNGDERPIFRFPPTALDSGCIRWAVSCTCILVSRPPKLF